MGRYRRQNRTLIFTQLPGCAAPAPFACSARGASAAACGA